MRTVGFILVVAAAVVAAIAANYVLLGYGGKTDDPVGRLTPRLAEVMAGSGDPDTLTPPPPPIDDDHGDRDDDD